MLTPEGIRWLMTQATGDSDEVAIMRVTDGKQVAAVPVSSAQVTADGSLMVEAIFGSELANFDWTTAEILSREGVVIDSETKDRGRKAPGSEWTLVREVALRPQD